MVNHSRLGAGWSTPAGVAGPDPKMPMPSELVEGVLGLLEDAGAPEVVNDQIVKLIEDWERQRDDT